MSILLLLLLAGAAPGAGGAEALSGFLLSRCWTAIVARPLDSSCSLVTFRKSPELVELRLVLALGLVEARVDAEPDELGTLGAGAGAGPA